jgi:hypothetical protein
MKSMSLQQTVRTRTSESCIEKQNEFKRGYQIRNNLAKDENGDQLADSRNILNKWKNYYSQLLNVHSISDIRQIEIHTAEQLEPAAAKLKKYKPPGSDQIPAELIQTRGETLLSEIYKLINSISNKNCLISGRGLMLFQVTKG